MAWLRVLALACVLVAALSIPPAHAGAGLADPPARVAHHLREVEEIARYFEGVLAAGCPRFASATAWRTYLDGEVDRVVLLVAHLEQAWLEAKQSPDDEVRRTAKAPRKRLDQTRAFVEKLQHCAGDNGSSLGPSGLWRRIEREVPRKQAEITLPR
jgi:hypothetical protein